MAEDKAGGAAAVEARGRGPAFEAPERGSADELLDAGAHAPIDAMRHSTAHVMAEAVLDAVPGREARHRPGHRRTASTTTSSCRGRSRRTTSPRSRSGCARASPPITRSSAARSPFDEGRALEDADGQAFKVEILDDLARKAPRRRRRCRR